MKRFLNKNNFICFLKTATGCGLLVYLFLHKRINFNFFTFENIPLLVQLFILQLVPFFIVTLRWHLIASRVYGMKMKFLTTLHISWAGQFFENFIPSTIGTDASRIYYAGKVSNLSKGDLFKITVADRLSALFAVTLCGILGLIFYFFHLAPAISLLSAAAVLILIRFSMRGLLKPFLQKAAFRMPPFGAVALSVVNFMLKALSLFLVVYFTKGSAGREDYYLCLAYQCIEVITILPVNAGIGQVLFGRVSSFAGILNGAQVYNIYFTVKIFFKATGFAGWLAIRRINKL
jgi:hypothetical protein